MRRFAGWAISLFFMIAAGTVVTAQERTVTDFSENPAGEWIVEPDGYFVPENAAIYIESLEEVDHGGRARTGITVTAELPLVYQPGYFLIRPPAPVRLTDVYSLRQIKLEVKGYNFNLEVSVLVRNGAGKLYEIWFGKIDHDGWSRRYRSVRGAPNDYSWDGEFVWEGIVVYLYPQEEAVSGTRRIDFSALMIE